MVISREDLIRILGEKIVKQAESMTSEAFQNQKWERLSDLLQAYEKLCHTDLFEARRSFLLGLDPQLQQLLVRHIFDGEKVASF